MTRQPRHPIVRSITVRDHRLDALEAAVSGAIREAIRDVATAAAQGRSIVGDVNGVWCWSGPVVLERWA